MNTRIKEVADRKSISYSEIAKRLGVSRQSLTNWTTGQRQLKLEDLNLIAGAISCNIIELLPAGEGYLHFYDENGEWQGIVKKYSPL